MRDANERSADFVALLEYLRGNRGIDLTGYKTPSLVRRFRKRMQDVGIDTYTGYTDYLQVHPDEFTHLLNTVLINVTSFFRDAPAWEYLSAKVLPRIVGAKAPESAIRIWSTGCASGEEAYTLALILVEALGVEQFRARVKIYATDIDEDALRLARQASYGEREVQGIPPKMLDKYFEREAGRYVFRGELRRSVIFGRHDLVHDAPISHVDLIACRNTLMYFNGETQGRIIGRLHFALNPNGILFLGKAEMLLSHTDVFTPLDLRLRVFERMDVETRERHVPLGYADAGDAGGVSTPRGRVRDASFDKAPVAQVVVDSTGFLALVNEEARSLFGLAPADVGRPFQDLQISYRPIELRSHIENVQSERRPVRLENIEWNRPGGELGVFEVQIMPLTDGTAMLGVGIAFIDRTAFRGLQKDVQHQREELETAYEELQSTNEELETTNEELQSTVEELETTNEELQATNEELETMNEELQSTNDEQQAINEQLQVRTRDLNQSNALLGSVLGSMHTGIAVLDRDLRVQMWNQQAQDMWGVREDEVRQRPFLGLDIGLEVSSLRDSLKACLDGKRDHAALSMSAIDRRGKQIECRLTCVPLLGPENLIEGVVLLMVNGTGSESRKGGSD